MAGVIHVEQNLDRKHLNGIWHTGTVVFGEEFYYVAEGILKCKPARTILGPPNRTLDMGSTTITYEAFLEYLDHLSHTTFRDQDYHMIQHNCNKFTDEVVFHLTGNTLPNYVTSLPDEIPKRLLRFMFRMSGCTVDTGKALTTHIGVEISSMSTSSSFSQARAMVSLEEDPFHGSKIFPVRLYVYDLSQGLVEKLPSSLLGENLGGLWHTGIVVYRLEFFYSSEGIKICQPSGTILGDPHKTADLGETLVPFEKYMAHLQKLSNTTFRPKDYELIKHNCNTFTDTMARYLTGQNIPSYITENANELRTSPLVTQMEKIMSPGSAINEPMLFNLGVFLRDTIAAVENLSIDDFIRRRKETGKLPFVDDS
ncbi:Desumoylating isopeptidase 1 [Lamellibrachia satsuma]|nr:Desumoylating isopeptidase 1 [Lamellibrachia satsuma]